MADTWPPLHAYALAHRCAQCGAEPGQPCDAPNKNARLARVDDALARLGLPPVSHRPTDRLHAVRQQAGVRHRARDIGNAPWAEDREPGRRYDTLGDAYQPPTHSAELTAGDQQ